MSTDAAQTARPASLSHDAQVIGVVGVAHGASHFLQLVLPPLFPWLKRDFALSYTQIGALMTAFFVTSGFGQAVAGFFVDRLGARRVLYAGLAMGGVAALVIAAAPSYAVLLTAAVLAGTGNAVFHPADFSLLNRHVSSPRLAHGFSAHGLTGYIGWAAAPVTVAGIAAWAGWRAAAFTASVIAFATLGVVFARRQLFADAAVAPGGGAPAASTTAAGTRSAPFAFLRVAPIWMCFLFFLLSTLAASALQNFAPTVLQVTHGLSLRTATASLTFYMLGGAVGITAGGFLATRGEAHGQRIAVVLGVAAMIAVVVATGATPGWTVPPGIALVGFCSGMAGPSRDLLVRRSALLRFGPRSFGRIYGFVYSGFDVGGAVAPLIFAGLLDRGLFREVLFGVALMQVLALLTALNIGRSASEQQTLATGGA